MGSGDKILLVKLVNKTSQPGMTHHALIEILINEQKCELDQ